MKQEFVKLAVQFATWLGFLVAAWWLWKTYGPKVTGKVSSVVSGRADGPSPSYYAPWLL